MRKNKILKPKSQHKNNNNNETHLQTFISEGGNTNKISSIMSLSRLKQLDPSEWSVEDVGTWLDFIHLSEYRPEFMKQAVSGAELIELDQQDLATLGVTKIGHRKKIEKRIQMIKHSLNGALDYASVDDGSETSSHSSATSYSSTGSTSSNLTNSHMESILSREKINIKCVFKDDISIFKISPNVTYVTLSSMIKKEYGTRMVVKFKDGEGDFVRIRKTKHFKQALKQWDGEKTLKLYLTEKERKVSKRQADILDTMLDAMIMINSKAKVLFFNKAAERMFGYTRKQVLNKNIRMLMSPAIAEKHDDYIKQYMETKKSTIIGKGRRVEAKHQDGHYFPIHLSVSVSKQKGKTLFTGTARIINEENSTTSNISNQSSSSSSSLSNNILESAKGMFSLLNGLLDAAIVIDENAIIQFANKVTHIKFGWKEGELIGKNIKIIMPSSIAQHHDEYMKKYLETGEGSIIGIGRDVVAMKKDGEILPIHLSVSEQQLGEGKHFFTGIMRDVEEDMQSKKSLLQQERDVLDNLIVPALIIDERGSVHAFNKAATELLGYSLLDVVGRNVSMLMTGDDRKNHDTYIANYVKTGQAKILNTTRDVIALHKDGTLLPVSLSVTVKRDGQKYIFTGVLQRK